ncbi:hypothetical protein RNQ72_10285, partial [Escherichia coli]|nr:hypothetical protein [Escherichia coli]
MSQNDIIIRTHYKSPHSLHIDSDIPTPSSEPINQFARQLITLLDTSDLSSMLSYCVTQEFTANCRKISQNCYSTALFTINFATSPIHAENILITGNDSNLLIVFYVQIMPDDFVMQLHR